MNIMILGAAGFIGTNLTLKLIENTNDNITLVDTNKKYFNHAIKSNQINRIRLIECNYDSDNDYENLLKGQDIVYHLVSTVVPTTSNQHIPQELEANVIFTAKILDACVKNSVKRVVFISSGGTVYGKEANCPLSEDTPLLPITSYGVQKMTIEKLLYLYNYMYGLDYRVARLSNPYGPYQRPNGVLGAATTFTYKALKNDEIVVYGDGSVVRDFIYIDDAINGIYNIANEEHDYKVFNLGSGYGTSIRKLLEIIQNTLNIELNITYREARKVDVPVNYLDISRYEMCHGKLYPTGLEEGILKTSQFMLNEYPELRRVI